MKALISIQSELKAPKGQYNNFGKYNYRSCEDILEAVKPLLSKHNCFLTISDDIVQMGDRFYIKATATLRSGDEQVQVSALARESLTKKGMDDSQITGTASSYARKYALNGLFCIDDTKDADVTNQHGNEKKDNPTPKSKATIEEAINEIQSAKTIADLTAIWNKYPDFQRNEDFSNNLSVKKDEIKNK